MKFLKISSLLVLSLLLFAPAALADVECELRPNSQRIRVESENEMLGAIRVRCTWEEDDIVAADGVNDCRQHVRSRDTVLGGREQ